MLPLQNVADFQNDYQQEAQVRLAQIYLAQDKIADAKKYLEQNANSTNVTIKNFASVELMKIYADEKNFAEAEKYANAVIANSKNSAATLEQAKVIKARSLMQQGKDKDAQTAYTAWKNLLIRKWRQKLYTPKHFTRTKQKLSNRQMKPFSN